ncbi:MAG: site-2 protease family protein [Planctomycetes bacterium]|nr:site-2 protease family protein [Planctomycetota bacterium]
MFGIQFEIHVLLIVWEILQIINMRSNGWPWAFIFTHIGILFGIIILHELGHCFAARKVGGYADRIMLWPLGGLAFAWTSNTAKNRLVVAAGGPAVNVALIPVLLAAMISLEVSITNPLWGVQNPLGEYWWLQILWELNLVLLVFNLTPMMPLDGGQMFRALLWFKLGFRRATEIAIYVGIVLGITMIFLALMAGHLANTMLFLIGVAAIMYCLYERQLLRHGALRDESESPYGNYAWSGDSWKTGTKQPDDRPEKPGFFAKLLEKRENRKQLQEIRENERIKMRINDLLDKVAVNGMDSLSGAEKKELERLSKKLHGK